MDGNHIIQASGSTSERNGRIRVRLRSYVDPTHEVSMMHGPMVQDVDSIILRCKSIETDHLVTETEICQ